MAIKGIEGSSNPWKRVPQVIFVPFAFVVKILCREIFGAKSIAFSGRKIQKVLFHDVLALAFIFLRVDSSKKAKFTMFFSRCGGHVTISLSKSS